MKIDEEDYLAHYGIIRRSGRYPWGSGGNENTHNKLLLDYVTGMRKQGLSETEIAKGLGMSVTELRAEKSIATNQQRQANIDMAQRLKDKGLSDTAIGTRMGKPESTIRNYLKPGAKDKLDVLHATTKVLKNAVDTNNPKGSPLVPIDVGRGVESHMQISSTKLATALAALKQEGYEVHNVQIRQLGTGHETKTKLLCPPGTTQKDAFLARTRISLVNGFSDDGGRTYGRLHEPIEINPKRVAVVHESPADGMIFVRPNVEDVSIGGSKYAQVRVAVGPDHFLKGMATYKDNLPEGIDVEFHTNKKDTGNKLDAMKRNDSDLAPGLPGGLKHPLLKSTRKQILANPGTPEERVISAMNLVNEEGNWRTWASSLSSQMLSKQNRDLIQSQLDMTFESRKNNFDSLKKLTNATVKKKLLTDFADATDASAVHLEAAALPRVNNHVILPLSNIKPSEIYAPNYNDGERVALIRHPHAGTFEIPDLVVNNKNAEGRKYLGPQAKDAVGIHHSVAQRLSGADFDGDTVLVIPNDRNRITITTALEGLKDFDPKASYPAYEGMKPIANTQLEMGKISNLITDMSLKGASRTELAAAVRHSMVVIDAEKHNLDHKQSYNDNGIKKLKEKYQTGGASTLISRAGADLRRPEHKPRPHAEGGPIDTTTGEKVFVPTGRPRKDGTPRIEKVARLSVTSDAHTLSSGTPTERLYANHSNKLKGIANQARLEAFNTPTPKQSPSAKKTYANEVKSLDAHLNLALRNAPLERRAQVIANANVSARRAANPTMDKETLKKISFQALEEARTRTGAKKHDIVITDAEWNAIQAGAISNSKLTQILNHADMDVVREHATPKNKILMTPTKTSRAKSMLADGYTRAQVANALGVSLSTLDNATNGG